MFTRSSGPPRRPQLKSPLGDRRSLLRRRHEIIERVAALPGVVAAGTINAFPLRDEGSVFEYRRADGRGTEDGSPLRAETRYVSRDCMRAMGIPLLRGASLPDQWARGAPMPMLISETAAQRLWSAEDPIGRIVLASWGPRLVVTGVVGNVRHLGLAEPPAPAVYLPQSRAPRLLTTLAVRTAGDPLMLVGPIRQVIQELDPNQPIRAVATLRGVMSESIARDRFFSVTREIGIRMALGATGGAIIRLGMRQSARLAGLGAIMGVVAAFGVMKVLSAVIRLEALSLFDVAAFAGGLGLVTAAAALAAYSPARRATRVDPAQTLRADG